MKFKKLCVDEIVDVNKYQITLVNNIATTRHLVIIVI